MDTWVMGIFQWGISSKWPINIYLIYLLANMINQSNTTGVGVQPPTFQQSHDAKTSFVSSSPQSAAARSRQLLPPAFGIAWLPPGSHQGRRILLGFPDGTSAFWRIPVVEGPWWRNVWGAHILTVLHFKCSADHPEVSRKAQSPVAGCWRFWGWMESSFKSPWYNQSAASLRSANRRKNILLRGWNVA